MMSVMYECVSVCLIVNLRNHIPNFTKFSVQLPVAVVRCLADDNAIRYVLPVLWMMSCFPIMCPIVLRIGYTWAPWWSKYSKFPTYSPGKFVIV